MASVILGLVRLIFVIFSFFAASPLFLFFPFYDTLRGEKVLGGGGLLSLPVLFIIIRRPRRRHLTLS